MRREVWRWNTESERFDPSALDRGEEARVDAHRLLAQSPSLLVLPPLWDHHGHIEPLGALLEQVDLRGCASMENALELIRARSAKLQPNTWVQGFGWDQNLWAGAFPSISDLDQACFGRPAYLKRIDGHAAWVSSEACRLAGVPLFSPTYPPGGRFSKKADGHFAGVAVDRAMEPFEAALPAPSEADVRERILLALKALKKAGLAGATDMGLEEAPSMALARLDEEGALPLPADGYFNTGKAGWEDCEIHRGPRFRVAGLKAYLDGALGSRGAALGEDYSDEPGNLGLLIHDSASLGSIVRNAAARGIALAMHSIGDRALSLALDVLEGLPMPPSLRFEHLQVTPPGLLPRMASLGATASIQPCHRLSDATWAPRRLGDRMAWAYRCASLRSARTRLLLGTDFPIEPPDPIRTLAAACCREEPLERLPLGLALRSMAPPAAFAPACQATLAAGEPWMDGSPEKRLLEWTPCGA